MDSLLVGVTIVSLLLALVMSGVAWTLWQNERERAAARAEALEALAFSGSFDERVIAPTPVARPPHTAARPVQPLAADADADDEDADWDSALRTTTAADRDEDDMPAAAGQHVRMRSAASTDDLFHAPPPTTGSGARFAIALAAVALVLTAGVVIYRAVHSPEILAAVAASRGQSAIEAPSGPHPLELLSLRHHLGGDGTFTVTGLVQNPLDGTPLGAIEAVVYLFDNDGRYFASGKAPLEIASVDPGDESPFVIAVSGVTTGVSRYRVGFRRPDGKVLAHVDRRGALPEGTTGDTIDARPALAVPASSLGRTGVASR